MVPLEIDRAVRYQWVKELSPQMRTGWRTTTFLSNGECGTMTLGSPLAVRLGNGTAEPRSRTGLVAVGREFLLPPRFVGNASYQASATTASG